MALPGKGNPFEKGLTEKPPISGIIKKTFTRIPLSTGTPLNINKLNQAVTKATPVLEVTTEAVVTTRSEAPISSSMPIDEEAPTNKEVTTNSAVSTKEVVTTKSEATYFSAASTEKAVTTKQVVTSSSVVHTNKEVTTQPAVTSTSVVATKFALSSEFIEQKEATAINPALLVSHYTREPHFMTKYLESADIGSRLSRVLRVILRETIGWGQEWASIPQSVLTERTNIPKAHISGAITELEDKEILLVRRQPGGKSHYAFRLQFFIPYMSEDELAYWINTKPTTKADLTTQLEVTTKTVNGETHSSVVGSNPQIGSNYQTGTAFINNNLSQESGSLKKDLKKDLKKSLSLSDFLKPIQLAELETRWLSFLRKEREREEKGLLKLIQQKPEEAETICKAFEIVLKEQDEYGEIKSGISVLETNYTGQYRSKALAAIIRQQQKEKESQVQTEMKVDRVESEDAEAQMQIIRMRCFETAFPDMAIRKQYILNICRENPMFSKFGVQSPIAVSYAVNQWAQGEGSAQVLAALDQEISPSQK